MSVVYLDLGRPEEAIPYLTEALELTKENGLVGSAVAELPGIWHAFTVHLEMRKKKIYI